MILLIQVGMVKCEMFLELFLKLFEMLSRFSEQQLIRVRLVVVVLLSSLTSFIYLLFTLLKFIQQLCSTSYRLQIESA